MPELGPVISRLRRDSIRPGEGKQAAVGVALRLTLAHDQAQGEKQQTQRYLGKALMAYQRTGEANHDFGEALTAIAQVTAHSCRPTNYAQVSECETGESVRSGCVKRGPQDEYT
jgi:hypothetical protein